MNKPAQLELVGRKIRQLRRQRKLTQVELAERVGIHQSDLSRMEQGEYKVGLDTLLKILQTDLRIPIVRAQETIDAVPADPEVAQRLGITVLYPVMHMRRVMFTTADRPFEVVETFYRADKYHYSVHLVRVKRKGKWTWKTEVETSA